MASILDPSNGETIRLLAQHNFGRHPVGSHTVLINPDASRLHASIVWDGEHWLLNDASTNGTFVNGQAILKGTRYQLQPGDKLQFGSPHAQSWQMLDTDAPKTMLISLNPGVESIELEGIVALPSEASPEVTLYPSPRGHWLCESASGVAPLKSGDCVGAQGNTWRFIEAAPVVETQALVQGAATQDLNIQFHFSVSQNEEHVSLRMIVDKQEIDLGQRNHHYLLLLLARQRLEDNALLSEEQGWLDKDELGKMLKLGENHINIQIYRIRKQIINALPSALVLPQVIERRTGEVRFAYPNVTINGGSQAQEMA